MINLKWYGDASIILENNNHKIAFDPFGKMQFPDRGRTGEGEAGGLPYEKEFREADEVFVTHGHFDHIYHIPRLYKGSGTRIYCTATPYNKLLSEGVSAGQLVQIGVDESIRSGPFTIKTYAGRHCRFDAPLIITKIFSGKIWRRPLYAIRLLLFELSYRENGEILFYEVECEGKRIQVMGSMNLNPKVEYPTGADVLILPLQGRSDQDEYALGIVDRLRPGKIVLDHYDDAFPPLTDEVDVTGFVKNVREKFGIQCKPLNKGLNVII